MCIRAQRGITLIEQIVFMVVVSVGVIGLVTAMGPMIRSSADPMVTKQSVAIAESLLGEVLHQPFTWCDPNDEPNARTALAYADCATPQNVATAGESRTSAISPFDNVRDYDSFAIDNIADPTGGGVVAGFRAEVAVAAAGAIFGIANDAALSVTVTVCRTAGGNPCAGRDSFSLTGYRFRYAPRI